MFGETENHMHHAFPVPLVPLPSLELELVSVSRIDILKTEIKLKHASCKFLEESGKVQRKKN